LKTCERCGANTEKLYKFNYTDEEVGKSVLMICWDCDWDIMNGGDPFEDESQIYYERMQQAYEYDPINVERPY